MSEFARVVASTGPYSRTRSDQFRSLLESWGNEAGGSGVIFGGGIADNGGVSIKLLAGWFASKWVPYELTTDQTYNGLPSDGVSALFARIERTAANPLSMTALDTYALLVDDNLTGALPAADLGWFRLGEVETVAGDITRIVFDPDVVPIGGGPPVMPTTIHAHRTQTVYAGYQSVVYGSLLIKGTLQVFGNLRVLEGA